MLRFRCWAAVSAQCSRMPGLQPKPTHIAYSVRNYESQGKSDASWLKVGAAFAHEDGKGFDITLTPFRSQAALSCARTSHAKRPRHSER